MKRYAAGFIGIAFLAMALVSAWPSLVSAAACASPNVCRSACNTGETPTADTCTTGGQCCQPAATTSGGSTIAFDNPITSNTIEDAVSTVLSTIRSVIVVLALVFIIVGAVLYVTSAGNEGRMTLAKGALTASMIGLALGLAAPSFLKEIGGVLGWNGSIVTDASVPTLSQIATSVLNFFLSIVGILSIIMLIVGGSAYLTSAGDEGRAETAKNIVKWAIIGVVVTFASLIIVTQVATLLV